MSRADVEKGARAALEAAADFCLNRYGVETDLFAGLDPAAIAEGVAAKRVCLNCGRSEPCELDKMETTPPPHNTPETWPGSPCTFDPAAIAEGVEPRLKFTSEFFCRAEGEPLCAGAVRQQEEIERLRVRVAELEGTIRAYGINTAWGG